MKKFTPAQYEEMFGVSVEDVQVCEDKEVVAVYLGEDEWCPYTGVEYTAVSEMGNRVNLMEF